MDFFNDIFHNLALLEFYFLNIIYILLYIDFLLSIFFQHSNILTRASHHWCLASNIVLVCAWIHDWVSNREAGDSRGYRVHYYVTVMRNQVYSLITITQYLHISYVFGFWWPMSCCCLYIVLHIIRCYHHPWWRHQIETFSALLAISAGNSPVSGDFPAQRPVTRSFDVFFDLRLNKQLSKQLWGWWFETPSCPVWRHWNPAW